MKKLQMLFFTGALLAASSVYAAEPSESYLSRVSGKFGTGILNVATGIVEVPKGMYIASHAQGAPTGIPVGLFKGLFQMIGRTGMGAVELATFYIPTKPMVNPPLVWENFNKDTTYNTNWEMYNTR